MSTVNIIIIFIIFCIVWLITNAINQIMIAKFQKEFQKQRIESAYVQISRLVVRSIAEIKGKERLNNDKM